MLPIQANSRTRLTLPPPTGVSVRLSDVLGEIADDLPETSQESRFGLGPCIRVAHERTFVSLNMKHPFPLPKHPESVVWVKFCTVLLQGDVLLSVLCAWGYAWYELHSWPTPIKTNTCLSGGQTGRATGDGRKT